jgi:hypothetical protein
MTNELDRLMTITDLSEMLGVPVDTMYGWRHGGEGLAGCGLSSSNEEDFPTLRTASHARTVKLTVNSPQTRAPELPIAGLNGDLPRLGGQ